MDRSAINSWKETIVSLISNISTIGGAVGNYYTAKIQADMQASSQAYQNTMREISAAQQTNAVTQQGIQLEDKASRLEAVLQQNSIKDRGAAEVSAAAAGVAGGSVDQALLGLRRSAIQSQHARMRNLDSALLSNKQEKSNINMKRILGEDISIIQRPSAASAMLGLGVSLVDNWDKNQPEGSRIADGATFGDWFKR